MKLGITISVTFVSSKAQVIRPNKGITVCNGLSTGSGTVAPAGEDNGEAMTVEEAAVEALLKYG